MTICQKIRKWLTAQVRCVRGGLTDDVEYSAGVTPDEPLPTGQVPSGRKARKSGPGHRAAWPRATAELWRAYRTWQSRMYVVVSLCWTHSRHWRFATKFQGRESPATIIIRCYDTYYVSSGCETDCSAETRGGSAVDSDIIISPGSRCRV